MPWPDLDGDGVPDETARFDTNGDGQLDTTLPLDADGDGQLDRFVDIDSDTDPIEAGLPREAAGRNDAGECPSIFAFHAEADGDGLRVELVDRAMQPSFDAWLAGDRLDLG